MKHFSSFNLQHSIISVVELPNLSGGCILGKLTYPTQADLVETALFLPGLHILWTIMVDSHGWVFAYNAYLISFTYFAYLVGTSGSLTWVGTFHLCNL